MIRKNCGIVAVLAVAVLDITLGRAQGSISAAEAKHHVGETTTVCGDVASTHYAAGSRGKWGAATWA